MVAAQFGNSPSEVDGWRVFLLNAPPQEEEEEADGNIRKRLPVRMLFKIHPHMHLLYLFIP